MDEPDICPPWWPRLLWWLHRPGGGGPINYPPAIDDMMSSLTMHTMSYMLLDKEAAQEIRSITEKQLVQSAQQLSQLHERSVSEKSLAGSRQ